MRALMLLVVLLAGVAGAQQATMNCRSAATNCNAAAFYAAGGQLTLGSSNAASDTITSLASAATATASVPALLIQAANVLDSTDLVFGVQSTGGANGFSYSGKLMMNANDIVGLSTADIVGFRSYQSTAGAGTNGFALTTSGAWLDLGGGANDRIKSDGTNLLFDTKINPNANDTTDVGATGQAWKTAWVSRGIVTNDGNTVKWAVAPISDNTTTASQLVYNADAQEPVIASATRKYNPLGQAKEWVVEKRVMVADVGFESTTCPTANPGIRGTGAAAVTIACTDAAAATNVVIAPENYRQMNTTATANTVSITDVSAATTELRYGPKLLQRVSIPSGSTANVRIWVALVPTATSLSGVDTGAISVVGFRFSTAVPDTNWQACSGDAASVVCTNTSTAPTTGTNDTLEIDCRETTACRFLINGSLVATRSTTLPASTTQLGQRVLVQTLTTTAKGLGYGRAALHTN